MKGTAGIVFAVVMFAVAALFISIGVDTWNTYRRTLNFEQGTAVVIGHVCQMDMTGPNSFTKNCEEYQFQAPDGKTVTFGEPIPKYPLGQEVPVFYDPKDPDHTLVLADEKNSMLTAMAATFLLSVPFIIMGLVPLVRGSAKRKRATSKTAHSPD